MFIKSAEAISAELTAAMQRYSDDRHEATDKMAAGGDSASDGALQMVAATGGFAFDLSTLLGDALDTLSILATLTQQDQLASGPGIDLPE